MTNVRTIHLYGELARLYGDKFKMAVKSLPEAVHALNTFFPGFKQYITDGRFQICRGPIRAEKEEDLQHTQQLTKKDVIMNFGNGDFHITPVLAGSDAKGKGWFQVILGAVITIIGVYTENPYLIALGVSFMIGGVGTLLIKPPNLSPTSTDRPDANKSFQFGGVINTMEEGEGIALTFGRWMCGSLVISSAYEAKEIV